MLSVPAESKEYRSRFPCFCNIMLNLTLLQFVTFRPAWWGIYSVLPYCSLSCTWLLFVSAFPAELCRFAYCTPNPCNTRIFVYKWILYATRCWWFGLSKEWKVWMNEWALAFFSPLSVLWRGQFKRTKNLGEWSKSNITFTDCILSHSLGKCKHRLSKQEFWVCALTATALATG